MDAAFGIFLIVLFVYVVVALCKRGRQHSAEMRELRQRQLRELRRKQDGRP